MTHVPSSFSRRASLLAAIGAAALATGCWRTPRSRAVPPGAPVLALGDSLTAGNGAVADGAFPAVLAQRTGWRVVNGGVSGDTSAQALARLPALLQEHHPELVVVCVGGNDFLQRLPEDRTRANILAIGKLVAAAKAQMLLVGVPQPSLLAAAARSLSDHAMYADLASDLNVPLYAGGWIRVLGDPSMRSDPIHGNAVGYAFFTDGLVERMREVGLLSAPEPKARP